MQPNPNNDNDIGTKIPANDGFNDPHPTAGLNTSGVDDSTTRTTGQVDAADDYGALNKVGTSPTKPADSVGANVPPEEPAGPDAPADEPVGDPPVADLDRGLLRDVNRQLLDLHKTLTATLQQNISEAEREHILAAANTITRVAEHIASAINLERDKAPEPAQPES